MDKQVNAFKMAQAQFDSVAEKLHLDPQIAQVLRHPMREYQFQIPVRMDDDSIRVFFGYRVQHNDARGPCKEASVFTLQKQWIPFAPLQCG
jgi:glutamate dehydrogenase (NAD(P)+)